MLPVLSRCITIGLLALLAAAHALAGGGPRNVLVVVNARSSESLEIGNAYRRARAIPYHNLITLATSTDYAVSPDVYLNEIEAPIRNYLRTRQLEEEITCIVLTRGVPQMVLRDNGFAVASLLAMMGMESARVGGRVPNPYYASTTPFSHRQTALAGMYLVTTLTGYSTRDVRQLIARAVTADGTMPDGRFLLQRSAQIPAASQEAAAVLLTRRGLRVEQVSTLPDDRANIIGYFSGGIYSGISRDSLAKMAFLPGAIADMAQPYGAAPANLDENARPLLAAAGWFVQAGVGGLHAVVGNAGLDSIPAAGRQALVLDRYAAGLSLAESFYVALPYLGGQNLIIGDPLCAPYAVKPTVAIESGDGPLSGTAALKITGTAIEPGQTIQRMDLYLDDRFFATVYEPQGAVIQLRIGDYALEYPVPPGADMGELLAGLAAHVNGHPVLSQPNGIRAVPSPATASLHIVARAPGADGNDIPVAVAVESADRPAVELSARLSGDRLVGGGQKPSPARGTLSFLGRRIKAGDEVVVKIGSERVAYTIPAENTNLSALLAALVGRINAAPALAGANGVRAFPDPDGMPVLLLEARAPGETGNRIPYAVTVTPVEGSQLRAYPDTPSRLMGGHDGSSASAQLAFVLGEPAVRRTVLLDTSRLSDGMHRLRAVACDASPAQAQGFAEITVQVRNLPDGPTVSLPDQLWTALGKVTVPVEAGEGIAKVEVFVDGQLLGAADAAPFAVDVPLTTLGRGAHDLWAEGVTAEGQRYRTVTTTLSVVVPPEVLRVTPDHAQPRGSVTHRVVGTGFQPDCTVRLAGVPAKTVIYHSPNTLDVVSEAGEAKRGPVDVMNPDGTTGSLPNAFEYYLPRVASTKITPTRDVVRPKGMARFTAKCFDQYGYPITAVITWTANGGAITHDGLFTAPPTTGQYLVHAAHPDAPKGWDAPITVGQADIPGGVLRHWLLLGAFQDEDGTGLEKAYIPETTVLPSHDETLAGNTWVSYAAPTPFVDLTERLSPVSNTIAYAHVYLKSPAEMDATLVFGSDDGIAMWLNGAPVYSLRVRRAADPNQARLPVHLRVGWNRLLVKVDQGTGSWGFYLRLQTREGQPLTGLAYALDNPH